MSRRLFVTGAQGFIGRYFVAHVLEALPDVLVLGVGRSPEHRDHFTHHITWRGMVPAPLTAPLAAAARDPRYDYVPLDLNDRPRLSELLAQFRPDTVVHLAAALRDDPPEQLVSSNVGSLVALIEAIAGGDLPPPLLVLGSSGAVYGAAAAVPIDEQTACSPLDPYAVSKVAAENMARVLMQRYGLQAIYARIFNPLGPGQDERHVCGRICSQVAAIAASLADPVLELGTLTATRDFVDVRDVARALLCLMERAQAGGTYNVGSGVETSVQRILELTLARARLTDTVRLKVMPARPSDIPRLVGRTDRLAALGFTCRHDLADSLQETVEYYLALRNRTHKRGGEAPNVYHVEVRSHHAYSVHVQAGLLAELPRRLEQRFGRRKCVLLSESRVARLYAEPLLYGCRQVGLDAHLLIVEEGEASKSLARFQEVIGRLQGLGVARRSVLINIGGGMVCDLGGFVASAYLRGIPYVNVPTSLLAQHDAAIGGKVAVNTPLAKNFVGAFHHPTAVFCDPEALRTLDRRDLAAGVAEAIKVALCGDPSLFRLLETGAGALLDARDPRLLTEVVRRCAARKIALLSPDPLEVDLRRVLNLGHTLAHPLEVEFGFEGIRHGEAVALGLAVATQVAVERGSCAAKDGDQILRLLAAYELPPPLPLDRCEAACTRLGAIRLVRDGRLYFVLPTGIGTVEIVPELGEGELVAALQALSRHPAIGWRLAA
jgi:3-dehydroquinate synthetase/nucleoside-diphosphate-sugar epimerase